MNYITTNFSSFLTKKNINEDAMSMLMLIFEINFVYTTELKTYSFQTITKLSVSFKYQYYLEIKHACFMRDDNKKIKKRETMTREKIAAFS